MTRGSALPSSSRRAASLNRTFAALADPTRRAILSQLARKESSVGTLAAPFRISLPAVSRHLRVLEHAGLLARTRQGRVHRCRLQAEPMRDAAAWLAYYQRFWEQQFDALARYLETASGKGQTSWPSPRSTRPSRSPSPAPTRRRAKRSSKRGRIRES